MSKLIAKGEAFNRQLPRPSCYNPYMKLRTLLAADPQTYQLPLEPGLLAALRMVVGVLLTLSLFDLLFTAINQRQADEAMGVFLPLFTTGYLLIILGYFAWGRLHEQLPSSYLPIGLALLILCTILEQHLRARYWLPLVSPNRGRDEIGLLMLGNAFQLFVRLLIPLVFICWQYSFRQVLVYCVSIAVINSTLAGFLLVTPLRFALGSSLFMGIVLAFVGYIVTRIVESQRQQRRELAAINEQLTQYAVTLEQLTISRERNRLARELHDTLAHTLSAVSVQLEAVDSALEHASANSTTPSAGPSPAGPPAAALTAPGSARMLLGKAMAQTRSGLTETRRALQALRASPLDDLGLRLALQNLAESTAKRAGLRLTLALADNVENLPANVEQNIYRVAQEALNNVLRHAEARTLGVTLTRTNGHLALRVQDDGHGFDTTGPDVANHYGLQGLRERAELVGAALSVQSAPGQGTTVQLVVDGV
jgi:signal transduction histidine kinase